jgi:hypothetical protein
MRYILMICQDESTVRVADEMRSDPEGFAWFEEMDGRGLLRGGARLRPSGDATTVRVRGEEVLLSDGPFTESKEQMAGYNVIECSDLDEAIEVASRHPVARYGSIEVRPLWERGRLVKVVGGRGVSKESFERGLQ